MARLVALLFFLLTGMALSGCGSREIQPVAVAGMVQLDDGPMAEGKIRFVEAGAPPIDMVVTQGKFRGKLKPGTYRVEFGIFEKAKLPPDFPMQGVDPGVRNILPDRYHVASDFKAEVKAAGGNEFSYHIESK